MPSFAEGDRVLRREARPVRGASVVAVDIQPDETLYHIAYDEGGEGWWPQEALETAPA